MDDAGVDVNVDDDADADTNADDADDDDDDDKDSEYIGDDVINLSTDNKTNVSSDRNLRSQQRKSNPGKPSDEVLATTKAIRKKKRAAKKVAKADKAARKKKKKAKEGNQNLVKNALVEPPVVRETSDE